VDLDAGSLTVDRSGALAEAVGASISLPLIVPPVRREQSMLVDGSLLDNLPLAPMSSSGEGQVLAIDIKRGESDSVQAQAGARAHGEHGPARRLPPLTDTMARIALLSSANTDEAARKYADMTIRVPLDGVGMLEFHQIDQAREAGRRAAEAALPEAPDWLLDGGSGPVSLAGRRTVIRL
ncbi:MAG TPA: patatin-like phospholipase family protein, partial [Solirubrobacteraceae bacterium]